MTLMRQFRLTADNLRSFDNCGLGLQMIFFPAGFGR